MKAHEPSHPRGTAPRQWLALCLLALLLFGAAPALPQSGSSRHITAINLVCPCSVEPVGEKSIKVKASIRNYDTVASRELLFRLAAYQHRSNGRYQELGWYFSAGSSFDLAVHAPVAAGKTAKVDVLMTLDSELSRSENISWSTHGVHSLLLGEIVRYDEHINDHRSFYGSDPKGRAIFPAVGEDGFSRTLTSIDYLTDTDKDGVTDYSERLMNTKPDDANDEPGTVTLDIMAVYTAELKAHYQGEPLSCMAHSLDWANMALRNSGIDARFRFVRTRGLEAGVVPAEAWSTGWDFVQRQEGLFESIHTERLEAGADLLVLFTSSTGGGSAVAPDLEHIMNYGHEVFANSFKAVLSQAVCGGPGSGRANSVLAHELGHNLGLLHSVRQHTSFVTFRWSRGHGEDRNFVTVMAYPEAYGLGYYTERVQYFSNPKLELCGSSKSRPCGVNRDEALAADAAGAIRAVMYKVAQWVPDPPDEDGDGLIDFIEKKLGTNPNRVDTDSDGIGDARDVEPTNVAVAYEPDRGQVLLPDGMDARNVIADFDDLAEIRAKTAKYELTGVFANPSLTNWNRFEAEDEAAGVEE